MSRIGRQRQNIVWALIRPAGLRGSLTLAALGLAIAGWTPNAVAAFNDGDEVAAEAAEHGEPADEMAAAPSEEALAEQAASEAGHASEGLPLAISEEEIEARLDEIVDVDFVQTPLKDLISILDEKHGLQIWLDEPALQDEGASIETPVSLTLRQVPLRTALYFVLHPLNLTTMYDHEVLVVTTETRAQTTFVTRVYSLPELGLADATGWSLFEKADDFRSLISNFTSAEWAPDSSAGGAISSAGGAIRFFPGTGLVVIRQTLPVHQEIRSLFEDLRDAINKVTVKVESASRER